MFNAPARIAELQIDAGRRVIVTSDIHANIPYFDGLLDKIGFCDDDVLIIDGDFLEKGNQNLEMLHRVMEMKENGNVFPILGNCDEWQLTFELGERADEYMRHYIQRKARGRGLIAEMLRECGVDPMEFKKLSEFLPQLEKKYADEWHFLASLPHAIETENFIFAHAGMSGDKDLHENSSDELTKRDAFLNEAQSFPKWLVVGHWPCVLYHESFVNANPIIDPDRKTVSIDGGCVLKDDGQLNALIIPDLSDPSGRIECDYYDPFPVKKVLSAQKESGSSYYIRWGDNSVQVLERGEEFSRCRHIRTGYEMDILTKYLFTDAEITNCNDCSDYVLPIEQGQCVSVIEETSRGYYVKTNGVSGWYFGELE